MAVTEGRILTGADVAGGNPVRTVRHTTQADDEGAPALKETQVVVLGDPSTPANLAGFDSSGRMQVNIAGSSGLNPGQTGNLSVAAGSAVTGVAGATTSRIVLDVSAAGNASFALLAAGFVGTVVFEQSFDPAGTAGTWAPVPCVPEDAAGNPLSTVAINGAYLRQFTQAMFGPKFFSIRCSAFTSGSLGVVASAGPGWYESQPALAPSAANIGAVSPARSTPVLTLNTPSAADAQLVAANASRNGWRLENDTNVDVIINETGSAVSTTTWTLRIPAGTTWECPAGFVTAAAIRVAGIVGSTLTAATTGTVKFTEF